MIDQLRVDLDAIYRNLENIHALTPDAKVFSVVKADAYGLGAVPVSKYIEPITDTYCVAIVDEAVELRDAGIEKPILILGYVPPEDAKVVVARDITVTVFTREQAQILDDTAKAQNKKASINIGIDTGHSRIGFVPGEETFDVIKEIATMEHLEIAGIFSHFSTADEREVDFTHLQRARFLDVIARLEGEGIDLGIRHLSNDAGAMRLREAGAMDAIRVGIGMYGQYPSAYVKAQQDVALEPTFTWEAIVSNVKTIEKGTSVSYGRTYIAEEPRVIATIQCGYADGYPRTLSNLGDVLIRGKRARIRGNVCMDQMMVDVTDIAGVSVGDVATLIGTDGQERIDADELADKTKTISYEIMTNIGKRVPRLYEG